MTVFDGAINFFNPYHKQIKDRGVLETLQQAGKLFAPFLQILGARFLIAAAEDPLKLTKNVMRLDEIDAELVILRDWFLPDLKRFPNFAEFIENYSGKVLVIKCLPGFDFAPPLEGAYMNPFIAERSAKWNAQRYIYSHFAPRDTKQLAPYLPMGCASVWLPKTSHYNRKIMLDEPHESLLNALTDRDDIRTRMYYHALDTSRELHRRGFEITTFCRKKSPAFLEIIKENSYISQLNAGDWVPFDELLAYYSQCSLFFSCFSETFGYSSFENLQLGNGIIAYSEARDPYTFTQMQNTALISLYMSPRLCADIIEEFFERYKELNLRPIVRGEAHAAYAAETFVKRVRSAL